LASEDGYESEEDISTTPEYQLLNNQDMKDTAPDNDKASDDESYEEDGMFSEDDYDGFAFLQDVTFNMNDKAVIPNSWILLDSQSTIDTFMNKRLLKNICDVRKALSLHFNARMTIVNKVRDLPGHGMIWFYKYGIANIVSLNNVKKKYRLTYDSTAYDCFNCINQMVLNLYLSHPKRGYSTQV